MNENCIVYKSDYKRINYLNRLVNRSTIFNDVKRRVKTIHNDYSIGRWFCLCEIRANELELIDDYCTKRGYERINDTHFFRDLSGWYGELDTTEESIINRYFDECIDWIYEDEGYELDDCDIFYKQAMEICRYNIAKKILDIRKQF